MTENPNSSSFAATNVSNTFDILSSYDNSPEINQQIRRRRRRKQSSGLIDGAASDEEPSLPPSDLHTLDLEREPSLHRSSSLEALDSLDTTPISPALLKVQAASTTGIQRVNSPTLRSLVHRRDTFPSYTMTTIANTNDTDDAPLQVMTDRPSGVKRTMSENMIAGDRDLTSSAPASARVTISHTNNNNNNLDNLEVTSNDNTIIRQHDPRSLHHSKSVLMTPIQEGSLSPHHSAISPAITPTPSATMTTPPTTTAAAAAATLATATIPRNHHSHGYHRVMMPKLTTNANTSDIPHEQGFLDFINAELQPGPSYPTADIVWGQTERDRVYNALLAVPFQLERLLWYGILMCLNSFLAVYTLLPMRVVGAMGAMCHAVLWRARGSFFGFKLLKKKEVPMAATVVATNKNKEKKNVKIAGSSGSNNKSNTSSADDSHHSKSSSSIKQPPSPLQGDQLFDILCACMFIGAIVFLWSIKAGAIYFWVKELTQEFLKLSVLHTALELGDKICCSFGVDVLEALAASCTAFASAPSWSWPRTFNVASDAILAFALLLAHSTVLIMQALVFGVAMNSQKNTLLALLIASNFTEIKGTVLKRFDPTKLFVLAGQDIVERFHLFIVFAFVIVEEMVGTGALRPSTRLLGQCAYVLLAEVVIDVTKHAVLGKFNEIRPGVYREFMKDMCEKVSVAQSHSMHRFVGFEPFAPAALFMRVVLSYAALYSETVSSSSVSSMNTSGDGGGVLVPADGSSSLFGLGSMNVYSFMSMGLSVFESVRWVGVYVLAWMVLTGFTILLGFVIKRSAVQYLKSYDATRRVRGAVPRHRDRID